MADSSCPGQLTAHAPLVPVQAFDHATCSQVIRSQVAQTTIGMPVTNPQGGFNDRWLLQEHANPLLGMKAGLLQGVHDEDPCKDLDRSPL